MKQITDIQIAAVMMQAKYYAKAVIEYKKEYDETGLNFYKHTENKYRSNLGAVCRVLETIGLVDEEGKAYLSFLDEAARELSEEREKQS